MPKLSIAIRIHFSTSCPNEQSIAILLNTALSSGNFSTLRVSQGPSAEAEDHRKEPLKHKCYAGAEIDYNVTIRCISPFIWNVVRRVISTR